MNETLEERILNRVSDLAYEVGWMSGIFDQDDKTWDEFEPVLTKAQRRRDRFVAWAAERLSRETQP